MLTLDTRIKLFGEDHPKTADSYHEVGCTQHALSDYTAALGEDHPKTADSYHSAGVTQQSLMDYTPALESKKRALDIRIKLFGEDHPKTADSYMKYGLHNVR